MVDYFEIGHIDNTHGLKGEIKVTCYSSNIKRFEELKTILILNKGTYVPYEIEGVRYQKDVVLLKLKTIDVIEQAERLKGLSIFIPRDDAKALKDNQYFIADLLGSEVYEDDNLLGVLDDVFTAGAADVYVIKCKGKDDLLLPAIGSVIKSVDVANKKIQVVVPEGLK